MNVITQHTPAPWIVCEERPDEVLFKDGERVLPLVCTVETGNADVEQWQADARLISASPELLKFSSGIASVVRSSGANLCSTATEAERSAFISGILDAWNNGGYDAIAKATGVTS